MSNTNNSQDKKSEFSQWINPQGSLFGYLYRIGEIPNCNPPLYGVTISVPNGKGESPAHETFDLTVTDARVLSLLLRYEAAINEDPKTKANISFRCYGLRSKKPYTIEQGDYAGKVVTPWGGNLSRIYHLSINGTVLYSSKENADEGESKTDQQAASQVAVQDVPSDASIDAQQLVA